MPILHNNESYNTLGSLYANAGDWIDCEVGFSTQYSIGSGTSNPFTYVTTGTQHYITSSPASFEDYGFLAGDVVDLTFTIASTGGVATESKTILFINGNTLFLDSAISYFVGLANTVVFPTSGTWSGMSITANKKPASIDAIINLTQNGSNSLASVLDGSYNKFQVQDLSTLTVTNSVAMTQLGDKSGGLIKDVLLTYDADANDGWKDWTITYKMWQWGVIKDGYSEPNYYDNADCLAPIVNIKAFSQFGNPNGILESSSANTEANTGGFNENYNGGVNNYTFQDIQFKDSLGNNIDSLDYSGDCTFVATIEAPNQDTVLSTYRIGLLFRPSDGSVYQNLLTNAGENLLLNAPDVDFNHSTSPDVTVYSGYVNSDGAAWDLTNLQFEISGTTLTVSGEVQPNAAALAYFDAFPDGERLTTMWVSLANHNYTGQFSDRVNLTILNEDNIDAPTLGIKIPNVVNEYLYDHAVNNITAPLKQTTTEDDVLYKSNFLLVDNIEYEGVRTRIYAYNTTTEEEFTLENNFFSFENVPNISGQFQPNFLIPRGFGLPPTSDRNKIELIRKPSLDTAGFYGIELRYGFLNDWRYWLQQANVNNDFFDITEPFNGKNKNWKPYNDLGDWIIRVAYYTSVDGVEDFNNFEMGILPYENDLNVSTVNTYLINSTGQTATNLLDNEVHTLTSVCTWNQNYLNPWAEVTIEDKEAGNRWVISTELPQGNISANPLKPLAGEVGLQMTVVSNVATLKCLIDTNIVDASDVCISTRIYSEEAAGEEFLITDLKDAALAYSLRRVSNDSVYSDNKAIRIRRSSDDSEQDIGFDGMDLDTASLLTFVGANDGYITKWYDQSGAGFHATQTLQANQPLIVLAGVVNLSSNGLPAIDFDGSNDFLDVPTIAVTNGIYESFVFDRATTGIISLSLGNFTTQLPYTTLWEFSNDLESRVSDGVSNISPSDTATGSFNISVFRDNGSTTTTMYRNGAYLGDDSSLYLTTLNLNTIGRLQGFGGEPSHTGNMQEIVLYQKSKSSSRMFIENNTNNYYSLY